MILSGALSAPWLALRFLRKPKRKEEEPAGMRRVRDTPASHCIPHTMLVTGGYSRALSYSHQREFILRSLRSLIHKVGSPSNNAICLLTGLEFYFHSNSPRGTLIPAMDQMSGKANGMF